MRICSLALLTILLTSVLPVKAAVSKPHVIALGKWTTVPWSSGTEDGKPQTLKVRALMVDGRVKEYILGVPHEITDRLFVAASWYRDYVAYCGVSDDGQKFEIVAQVSRRKPVVKKLVAGDKLSEDAAPDSACESPVWQRNPTQVSFQPPGGAKQTYAVRGHIVDVVDDEPDTEASK